MNEEMRSAEEILAEMGIGMDEALEADASVRYKQGRDSRICLCGHPMGRHNVVGGIVMCKPNKMDCPCKKARAVLEAEDTRKFVRKTVGSGKFHALGLGLVSSAVAGKSVKWIIEMVCDKCGEESEVLSPTPVTQNGFLSGEVTGYDVLLCSSCRIDM
jgi:hypothetical protein